MALAASKVPVTSRPASGCCSRAPVRCPRLVCQATASSSSSSRSQQQQVQAGSSPAALLQKAAALAAAGALVLGSCGAPAALAEEGRVLCDAACESSLESREMVTTPSGLQYRDITVGEGPEPVKGFQVVAHYVAMTPAGRVFENSLEKGTPFDIRVGAGQVISGLDEGLASMHVGGVRRLYIPGELAFPKPLKAAPGRPSVLANSPVVFDVQLLYIPGLE